MYRRRFFGFVEVGRLFVLLACVAAVVTGAHATVWVEFADETATRLAGDPDLTTSDSEEKDYAWGDVDMDGDTDLVVVRKEPFTSSGKRVNVLLINDNGVLTERTTEFASASLYAGDSGFDSATNDRDVVLVDVDRDGWLDMVTAPTLSDGDPKEVGHPRIYMNLGCSGACDGTDDWLGFRYEPDRIPSMLSHSSQAGHNPRFCAVAFGDVDGDLYPDLYFGDYDSGPSMPSGADYNDKLLLNHGASNPGHFYDNTFDNFPGQITIPGSSPAPFEVSAFGAADVLADMNGDGTVDILKQTSLNPPQYVGIAYNDPDDEGFFSTFEVAYLNQPYHINVGDLNNDEKLDFVVADDGDDRYVLNQNTEADGTVNFVSYLYDFENASNPGHESDDDGFGSNNLIVDLNNDGWNDVLIADVDVDIFGYSRRMHIYKNLGGEPGDQVILQEQVSGTNCSFIFGNPASCLVTGIPSNLLECVHDVAVFDINGDGWKDMVLGRCNGTDVWMNQPQLTAAGRVPDGNDEPGPQLTLDKIEGVGLRITFDFGDSCKLEDTDYEIYHGDIGDWDSHEPLTCSTGSSTNVELLVDPPGDKYYIIVPHNNEVEGHYGVGTGYIRGQGADSCRFKFDEDCP